ncbi:MAG: EscU/YscU/HrcU family type III secretion system export apparatus switch protein [Pseudomonadota bacterium]
MSNDQSEEKTEEASDRKLQKLRDDGIIATSSIGSEYMGVGAGIAAAAVMLPVMVDRFKEGFDVALASLNQPAAESQGAFVRYFLLDIHLPLIVVILALLVASIGFRLLVNGGFVFAVSQVAPQLSHISPVSGLQRLFKGRTLTELAAAFVRMTVLLIVCVGLAWYWHGTLVNLDLCVPGCAQDVTLQILWSLLITLGALIIVSVIFDVGVQKAFFKIEQRMTKSEQKRERKETVGQPEIRSERRRIQNEFAETAHTVGVKNAVAYFTAADLVVAIAFHPKKIPLPRVAVRARGGDAHQLLAKLRRGGIPGMQHEEIANACRTLPPGSPVPREIFLPLATELRRLLP